MTSAGNLTVDSIFLHDSDICGHHISKDIWTPHTCTLAKEKRGPMGGAPYTGPRLGDGPIFEVSVSRLYAKECPGKLPMLAS